MCNIKAWRVTFYLAVFLLKTGSVWSNTIYVEPLGNDTRSGLNAWTNAVATIGVGVSKASGGDIILVSNGTYNITAAISISIGITLTNFSGNPEDTTINAQGLGRVIIVNHTNALVSGFSLINGQYVNFAGVYLANGIVENCIISSNHTTGPAASGGGGYVTGISTLRYCTVSANTVTNSSNPAGGGLRLSGTNAYLIGCRIIGNVASNGAVAAIRGGGIYAEGGWILDCTVASNYVSAFGGGVCIYGTNVTVISNCLIQANTGDGGGMFIAGVSNVIYRTKVLNNSGISGGIRQAGNACYDGMTIISNSDYGLRQTAGGFIALHNSLIADHTGNYRAGVELLNPTGTVVNCTIVGNIATNASSHNGGLYVSGSGSLLVNNLVAVSNFAASAPNIFCAQSVIYHSCWPEATNPANGNITNNPAFVNYADRDYRLSHGSRCINTGTNIEWMTGALDLDEHPRQDRFSGKVDMGCYEYLPEGMLFMSK